MHLLVSNDDGVHAPGLRALATALDDLGTVWVVAPQSERSAQSHALTMHKPLRAAELDTRRWSLSGTPADCVYFALHHLLPEKPALVVSGINHGSNLGNDVFYSGTVAAAMEGCFSGYPAIAFSLHTQGSTDKPRWETAAAVARRVVEGVLARGVPRRLLLNVNVPNVPLDRLKGLKATVLGERRYHPLVTVGRDPRGREYFWIGGEHDDFLPIEGSDGPAIEEGWATITPIHPDLTLHDYVPELRRWTDG